MAKVSKTARRRINRAHGAKGGPKTPKGIAISCKNPTKDALTAHQPLPHEDPEQVRVVVLRCFDAYPPHTELQLALVDRIVSACLLRDRCERVLHATATEQVLNAHADLDRAHELEVDALKGRMKTDPAAAVAGLRQSAWGCRWLIGRWARVRRALEDSGTLAAHDHEEMARWCGLDPGVDQPSDPELFSLRLHSVLSRTHPSDGELRWCFASVPAEVQALYRERWGDPEANRAQLRRWIDQAMDELSAREEQLRTHREAVARSVAEEKAMLPQDDQKASLWLRYWKEANAAFSRALHALQTALAEEQDNSAAEEGAEDQSEAAEPAPAASSRNEPNPPPEPSLSCESTASSGAAAAPVLEPVSRVVAAGLQAAPSTAIAAADAGLKSAATRVMAGPGAGFPAAPTGVLPAADESDPEESSEERADVGLEQAATTTSPNEPNSPPEPSLSCESTASSGAAAATVLEPVLRVVAAGLQAAPSTAIAAADAGLKSAATRVMAGPGAGFPAAPTGVLPAADESDPEESSQERADVGLEQAATTTSPNEPNSPPEPSLSPESNEGSEAAAATILESVAGVVAAVAATFHQDAEAREARRAGRAPEIAERTREPSPPQMNRKLRRELEKERREDEKKERRQARNRGRAAGPEAPGHRLVQPAAAPVLNVWATPRPTET